MWLSEKDEAMVTCTCILRGGAIEVVAGCPIHTKPVAPEVGASEPERASTPIEEWANAAAKRIEQVTGTVERIEDAVEELTDHISIGRHSEQIASIQKSLARIEREVFPMHVFNGPGREPAGVIATSFTQRLVDARERATQALEAAAGDFDVCQRRLLEIVANMRRDAIPPDVVIALTDIATSLGDNGIAASKAAREART